MRSTTIAQCANIKDGYKKSEVIVNAYEKDKICRNWNQLYS